MKIFNWIKKKVFESIVKDAISQLPELKNAALKYLAEHKNELLEKAKDTVIELIKEKIKSKSTVAS